MQPGVIPPAPFALHRLAPWAWLLLPLACHLGFSWIGFNPTDDGWLQAVARRMLDGEFPHRDFIFVRPALSALLQVPVVWLGGEHTIWLSRLWGWLTIGGLSWIWSGFALPGRTPWAVRYPLFAAVFFLTAHVFPVMAWHTLDGILLCSLAVALAARGTPDGLRAAFVCVGLAALCRQNFALFTPFLVLASPDPRRWTAMFWAALPPVAYLAATAAAGCLPEFIHQAAATGGAFKGAAIDRFTQTPVFLWAIPVGALAGFVIHFAGRRPGAAGGLLVLLTALVAAGFAAVNLWSGAGGFHLGAFKFFGFALGLVLAVAVAGRGWPGAERLTLVAGLGLTWVTTISLGWNSPALMTGVLLVLVWRGGHRLLADAGQPAERWSQGVALISLVAIGAAFWHARQLYPYRDRAAAELRFEVGDVLPGAAGMRTNELTYAVLADLRQLIAQCEAEHQPYAILTDCAAVWIRSPQRNLLPAEWPQETELGYDAKLVNRVVDAVRGLPPGSRVFVQRVLISELSLGLYGVPLEWNYYFVQNWVRKHARRTGESRFFEVYLPPAPP